MLEDRIRELMASDDACVTCISFEVIETIANESMREFFIASSGAVFTLVSGFLTLFVLWKLTGALMGKAFDYAELMSVVLRTALVAGITANPSQLFDVFYLAYDFGINFAGRALSSSPNSVGLADLLSEAEASVRLGLGPKISDMFRELSFYRIGAMLAMIALIVPLAVLTWEMVKYFFRPMFVTFGIGMMLPFISASLIFDRTTPIAVNAFKMMLASSLQLVLAASVVSFMILIMGSMASVAQNEPTIDLFGTLYFTILLTTVVLIFLFPVVMQLPEAVLGVFSGGGAGGQLGMGAVGGAISGAATGGASTIAKAATSARGRLPF